MTQDERRRGLMMASGRLPSAYQEVEYIQTVDAGSYINTELEVSSGYQISGKAINYDTTGLLGVFFGSSDTKSGVSCHFTGYNGAYYFGIINGVQVNSGVWSPGDITEFVYNNSANQIIANDVVLATGQVTGQGYILIGRRGATSGVAETDFYGSNTRYYYFKILDKSTNQLVRDFIPCYRKSDNVIGLYDLVYGVFYTNAGTGTFQKGADV